MKTLVLFLLLASACLAQEFPDAPRALPWDFYAVHAAHAFVLAYDTGWSASHVNGRTCFEVNPTFATSDGRLKTGKAAAFDAGFFTAYLVTDLIFRKKYPGNKFVRFIFDGATGIALIGPGRQVAREMSGSSCK